MVDAGGGEGVGGAGRGEGTGEEGGREENGDGGRTEGRGRREKERGKGKRRRELGRKEGRIREEVEDKKSGREKWFAWRKRRKCRVKVEGEEWGEVERRGRRKGRWRNRA